MGGLLSGRIGLSNSIIKNQSNTKSKKIGVVYDVILDETHPYAVNNEIGSLFIGSILFRTIDNLISTEDELPIAHPIDKNFKSIPVKNEIVEIYDLIDGMYGYRRLTININPSVTNTGNSIKNSFTPVKESSSTISDYKTTSVTGITNTNFDNSSKFDGFGKYYNPQIGLHKLKLYEGDSIIESRFGQSIRFSAYNNTKTEFSPTIILRNSESSKNRKETESISVEEDINRDGSILAMTSNQYQLPFQPGTVDDNGTSDFETKPDSFQNYPSKLIGDQLLINSGRLIFSAKSAEMIFYSKKNYGFISDGGLSIDNKLGIDISVNDNINVITNSRDIVLYTDNGSIFLGNKDMEPLVKGQQLVEILSELIDAITRQIFLTPAGPSAQGPTNISEFGTIKSKLNVILSKLNQTA
jgi:hypothetical protein